MTFEGRYVLILGLAREGESLARFLAERGAHVTVTDAAPASRLEPRLRALEGLPIDFALGGDHPELVSQADAFFVSPGVPESNAVYQAARDGGLPLQSMTTLFFDLCPAPIVGVTGSSGKTTTTGLIGHILRTAGREVAVGGNIGDPMLDLLPSIHSRTIVVLELSSFQLAILASSPHIAVVTNISPNHLDRHSSMDRYVEAKRNIVRHQTGTNWAVLNAADSQSSGFAQATPARVRWFGLEPGRRLAATVHDGFASVAHDLAFQPVLAESEIPLLGRHNVENVLGALAATDILGVEPEDMAEAIQTYRPAPHRLQTVAECRGVRYVDDSIATSPSRATVALHAIDAPVLLIAGGRDKNLPWDDFARLVVEKVRALFLIGEAADGIEQIVRRQIRTKRGVLRARAIQRCSSLEEAVTMASQMAVSGDVVLLSPACASYDMFTDFEERGQVFARTVEALDAA